MEKNCQQSQKFVGNSKLMMIYRMLEVRYPLVDIRW